MTFHDEISDQATKIGSSVGIGCLLTVITQEMTIYLKFCHEMSPRLDKMMIFHIAAHSDV